MAESRPLLTFARCTIIPQSAPLPELGIDRPKSRRAELGVAVPHSASQRPAPSGFHGEAEKMAPDDTVMHRKSI